MKKTKKLVLAKETIRRLNDNQLKGVDGAASIFTCYDNDSCYNQDAAVSLGCPSA